MKIYYEAGLYSFRPWSGAVDTYNRVRNAGKLDDLEAILDDLYPDGVDETTINDLLCFESETVYEWVGIPSDDEDEDDDESGEI